MVTPELGVGIACMGFLGFFVLLFGTLALMRWFRHKERLAMIEQGLMPADAVKPRNNGKGTLAWGIGIAAFGLALLCGLSPLVFKAASDPYISIASAAPSLLPGLVILFMGLALIIIYFVTRPATPDESPPEAPPPLDFDVTPDLPPLEVEDEEPTEE
jgi:hypothetical protein